MWVWSLSQENFLEKSMATHSSILAWRIPWTKEPGGLQSIRLHRVGHNWSDLAHIHSEHRSYFLFYHKLLSQSLPLIRLFNPFTFLVSQGVSKAMLPLKVVGNNLFHVSLFSSGIQSSIFTHFPCMSSYCLPFVYICFCHFYKDTTHKIQAYSVLLFFTLLALCRYCIFYKLTL